MKKVLILSGVIVWMISLSAQYGQSSFTQSPFNAINPDFMPQLDSDEPDSGNWYEKQHWWKEAKRVYSVDIHEAMEDLKRIAEEYEEKKKTVYTPLEASITSLPVTPAIAGPRIVTELTDVRKQRDQLLESTAADNRVALSHIEELEKTLEELKADFENISTLQSRAKEAFDMYAKQEKECENYEERALDYFERIEKVLDDKKAHDYYDMVENSLDNIRAINQYLSGPLLLYIDQTAAHVQTLVPKIKKTVEELEKKGIIIRVLSEKEKAELALLEQKRKEAKLKAEAAKKAAEDWKRMSWLGKAWYYVASFFSWLWSLITGFFSWIGGLFSGGGKPAPSPVKK